MNKTKQSKKEIIISEIQIWKQTKMLPEQYCDYLLALYTGGEGTGEPDKRSVKNKFLLKDFLFSICSVSISLFVIYFTELSIVLQTAILASFVGLLTGVGIYYTKKQLSPLLLYCSSASILLLASIEIVEGLFGGSPFPLYITLFLNCLMWIGVGVRWKMSYFTWSGSVGVVLLLFYILL